MEPEWGTNARKSLKYNHKNEYYIIQAILHTKICEKISKQINKVWEKFLHSKLFNTVKLQTGMVQII